MKRVALRTQLIAIVAVTLVFAVAFLALRPVPSPLSDAEYIAIAKTTPQGGLFFRTRDVPCRVARAWTVAVNCDYAAAPGAPTEKFRVYIDPRTSRVIEVEAQFDPE